VTESVVMVGDGGKNEDGWRVRGRRESLGNVGNVGVVGNEEEGTLL
jgi:hypothetical protein